MMVRISTLSRAFGALLVLALSACGPSGGDGDLPGVDCASDLLPGDLVITEIMGNPTGGDNGNEWFEIFNTTGAPIDLRGVILEYRSDPADETSGDVHAVIEGNGSTTIGSTEYFVFGGVLGEFAPEYVDYGYGDALGGFGNTEARRLAVYCDGVEIDAVTYTSTSDGESTALSNLLFPDANENDNWEDNWCVSISPYNAENLGTPGASNDCGEVAPGTCLDGDGDVVRETVPPLPGDLIITELMPNPAAVSDADGEWFEVAVQRDVDLNGLTIGNNDPADGIDDTVADNACLPVTAGSLLIFARNLDTATNGGLPEAVAEFGFGLVNGDARLFIGHDDGATHTVVDEVTWASSSAGVSLNLDPDEIDAAANDLAENFCPGESPYGDGDLGTPGAANRECPVVPPPGMCLDVVMSAVRPIVKPAPGELTITEFLANPDIIGDPDGEWIEIRADADVDLNGLEIRKLTDTGTASSSVIDAVECLRASSGSYTAITRDTEPTVNGCIEPAFGPATPDFTVSLNNSNNTIYLTSDGVDIDSVHYNGTSGGSSESLDENTDVWCANDADVYDTCLSGDNTGTPGAANPPCPSPSL